MTKPNTSNEYFTASEAADYARMTRAALYMANVR